MKANLALFIFMNLVREQCHEQGRAVGLSYLKHFMRIPESTFYRHVNNLIDNDLIIRIGRDKYSVSHELMSYMKPLVAVFPLQRKLI